MIYDRKQIEALLPHRGSILLVDEVIEISDDFIQAQKTFIASDPYFEGHFPNRPILPGIYIVEALAQTGAILVYHRSEYIGKFALLAGIDSMRFRKPVSPGDTLTLEATLIKLRHDFGIAKVTARIKEEIVAEGEIRFVITN